MFVMYIWCRVSNSVAGLMLMLVMGINVCLTVDLSILVIVSVVVLSVLLVAVAGEPLTVKTNRFQLSLVLTGQRPVDTVMLLGSTYPTYPKRWGHQPHWSVRT